MTIDSRTKGSEGEREAAEYLSILFKLQVQRTRQFCGAPGVADLRGLAGLHVEVKRCERLFIESALAQALRDAAATDVPVVLHRSNRCRWKFTFAADDLLRFLDAANALVDEGHRQAAQNQTDNSPPKEQT